MKSTNRKEQRQRSSYFGKSRSSACFGQEFRTYPTLSNISDTKVIILNILRGGRRCSVDLMTVKARHASPIVHSVHFYDADEALIQRLQNVISAGLDAGNSVLTSTTDAHRAQLCVSLRKRGIDVHQLENDGMLSFSNAHETLTHFMVNGMPDQKRFLASIGELIVTAKQAARNEMRGLTVFGEMVAVLWEQGHKKAALQLEALWNDLLNDRVFHLHCAYRRALFAHDAGASGMQSICESHSHVVGHAAA